MLVKADSMPFHKSNSTVHTDIDDIIVKIRSSIRQVLKAAKSNRRIKQEFDSFFNALFAIEAHCISYVSLS